MKKKIFTLAALAMCLVFAFTVVASCKPEGELTAPTLRLDGNVIWWNITDGADGYNVYLDGQLKEKVIGTRYSLASLADGTYSLQVTVCKGGKESAKSNSVTYVKESTLQPTQSRLTYSDVNGLSYDYGGIMKTVTDSVVDRQLMDRNLWAGFVNQFRPHTDKQGNTYYVDDQGGGWRGEFWGKLMIGAVETYGQTKSDELYGVLEETTRDLLTTQEADGRIASYNRKSQDPDSNEFYFWDVWCRKYVLMGMQSFYGICKDDALKAELVESMLKQVDYMLEYIGDSKDYIITETGSAHGGLAASSILEAIVRLYEMTGERRVLDFATHIVNCGGSLNGNQIEQAISGTTLPHTWGARKGYELTSFFDGVMDYYLVTGITKYRTAAVNFADLVLNNEITVTGGAGYDSEEFNHATVEQANPANARANMETCVTTTITRFFYKVYRVTGDIRYLDSLERTIYNAIFGSVDTENRFDHAFTSYFNLIYSVKFRASGGGMHMEECDYGCCIAFGAAGTGLIHRINYTQSENALNVNLYLQGKAVMNTPAGNKVSLTTQTNYPYASSVKIVLGDLEKAEQFDLNLRIPAWSEQTTVAVNGRQLQGAAAGEYFTISNEWKSGDEISINFDMNPRLYWGSSECSNANAKYNVAVLYGPLALARDARLDGGEIYQTVNFATENGRVLLTPSTTANFNNIAEFAVQLEGGGVIHMVDYASAGKTYDEESILSVFLPTTDYWKENADFGAGVTLACSQSGNILSKGADGMLTLAGRVNDYDADDLTAFKLVFDDRGGGRYSIRMASSDSSKAFTMVDVAGYPFKRLVERDYVEGDENQLFVIKRVGLYNYKIVSVANKQLISEGDNTDIQMYSEADSQKQRWYVVVK